MGFEPTRAEHNGLAVHHLNHSATLSYTLKNHYSHYQGQKLQTKSKKLEYTRKACMQKQYKTPVRTNA